MSDDDPSCVGRVSTTRVFQSLIGSLLCCVLGMQTVTLHGVIELSTLLYDRWPKRDDGQTQRSQDRLRMMWPLVPTYRLPRCRRMLQQPHLDGRLIPLVISCRRNSIKQTFIWQRTVHWWTATSFGDALYRPFAVNCSVRWLPFDPSGCRSRSRWDGTG
jgi:hypothetical protein